jgi:preprotein translocase subunit YajC
MTTISKRKPSSLRKTVSMPGSVRPGRAAAFLILGLCIFLLYGCAPQPQTGAPQEPMSQGQFFFQTIYFLALIFFGYYFLISRPAMLKNEQQKKLIAGLKKGDEVITSSGILGRVNSVADDVVTIDAGSNVKLQVVASHVALRKQPTPNAKSNSKS